MRELSFMAKAISTGEWLYGDLTHYSDKSVQIWVRGFDGQRENYMAEPETVGEFTGAEDRHGDPIYEGDIIKSKGKRARAAYAVEYSKNICGFIARGIGVLVSPCLNPGTMKDYEIIGNIYDNPELLGGEKHE